MTATKQSKRRLGRIGLALGVLVAVAAVAGPAAAWDRHHDRGFFSFGFSAPVYGYYPPPYYPPPAYYYPPPAYYYYPPPPRYYLYPPAASFRFVVPFRG